jgi:murein L,D-transpeptidase YafK
MRWFPLLFALMLGDAQALQNAGLESVLDYLSISAQGRIKKHFDHANVDYPPQRIQLIALKKTRRLELWAYQQNEWHFIHDYAIFAASGEAGPKLREGDKQVPEGFYRITELNPNSQFHLSMKLNYPNGFDWHHATREGRTAPGSNIFIHGSAWSAGCLAIGNRYIEELFILVAKVGLDKSAVVILPYDFREQEISMTDSEPIWLRELYSYMKLRLAQFPLTDKGVGCTSDCREASSTR